MNQQICGAVNALREALNTYELETDHNTRERTLSTMGYNWDPSRYNPTIQELIHPNNPLVLIDTDSIPEMEEIGFGQSKLYHNEARLAAYIADCFYNSYKDNEDNNLVPTILSPYTAQIGAIQSYIRDPRIRRQCITIYKSQGREYPVVIVSFVRKNPRGEIGFLKEPELRAQTYVACSRAMAKLILLFSFSTFQGYPDFATLLDRCRDISLIPDTRELWREVE